tara:strand:+ start:30 stop:632 length:603 start_codon:yes stop_codon:yes gene_type:complete
MSDRKVRINKDGKKIVTRTNAQGVKVKKVMSAKNDDGKRTKVSTSRTNDQGVTKKTTADGRKIKKVTNSAGTVVRKKTNKSGATVTTQTKKDGSKKIERKKEDGTGTTRETNKRGRVTSISRTNKDGQTKNHKKGSVAVKAANIAKSGTSKLAKRMQSLKAKKKAARKAGDTDKLTSLRKKSQSTRRNIKANIRARRAGE